MRLAKDLPEESWEREAKLVAVKQTVLTEVSDDIAVVLKEASYLSNLQHPNIVAYYTAFTSCSSTANEDKNADPCSESDPLRSRCAITKAPAPKYSSKALRFSDGPSLCIVEELVEGASVAKVIKLSSGEHGIGPMSESEIAAVICDVLQALLYVHEECRLVHRDIKPLNMLLDRNTSSVKLCDFGTCADLNQQVGRYTVIGTIGWIAPEVLDSGVMDHRSGNITTHSFPSDVWSLGISALEMARPGSSKQVLAEYIKELSSMPCSAQPTVKNTRVSFLKEKISSERLRDFIACCVRTDPKIRPTVAKLLKHPLIHENGVSNEKVRREKISEIILRVSNEAKARAAENEKMNDDAIALPQLAVSTVTKDRCMEAINAMKRDFFAAQSPLSEVPRSTTYTWCIPGHIGCMISSDMFRHMPKPPKLSDLTLSALTPNSASTNPASKGRGAAVEKPLFDAVVLPATVESQRVVLDIVKRHRRLGAAYTSEGWKEIDGRSDMRYSFDELACPDLKHEVFVQLHNDLLRAFKACCMSIPNFEATFLGSFMQALTPSGVNVQRVRDFLTYLHRMEHDDLKRTYCGWIESNEPKATATRGFTAFPCTRSSTRLLRTDELLQFPRMPQLAKPMNAVDEEHVATSDGICPEPLVNPSAYLFNKWLKEKKASALGSC
uniref:Protein kinase domain-containing protein n=1 Tax=Trypanosoma vivax (strain Y486) TaxID=1055687 RepID=G0U3F2_TRYVY|nr:putative protein kinase [Trypanosoma vivax Y486]